MVRAFGRSPGDVAPGVVPGGGERIGRAFICLFCSSRVEDGNRYHQFRAAQFAY